MPEHPRRGAQTCERLTVVGQTLELARGQLGRWEQGSTQLLPVEAGKLLAAIDRQRRTWAAAGWRQAGSEFEIIQRVSARNEELEDRIRAAEGDALAHEAAVYGDWLLAQGDPRGHVASVALNLDASPNEIVNEHAVHLFGPPTRPLIDESFGNLRWSGPMITWASFLRVEDRERVRLLERLLALPVFAGLRTLKIAVAAPHDFGNLLARSSSASSLRSLSLDAVSVMSFDDARFERLEELDLYVGEVRFAALFVPSLRRLSILWRHPGAMRASRLEQLDAPSLEHFEFETPWYAHDLQQHGPLHPQLASWLELPAFARLRVLTLRSELDSQPYSAGLAQVLARAPARETLERVDLREATLTPEARDELVALRGGPLLMLP